MFSDFLEEAQVGRRCGGVLLYRGSRRRSKAETTAEGTARRDSAQLSAVFLYLFVAGVILFPASVFTLGLLSVIPQKPTTSFVFNLFS